MRLLCYAFSAAEEFTKKGNAIRHDWPEDRDQQGRDIQVLAYAVASPRSPYSLKLWAYDRLTEIAMEYRRTGQPHSIPSEMIWWSLGVVAGDIERPKPRGRPSNAARDQMIAEMFAWLVDELGETEASAREMIRAAVPRAGGGSLTRERVRDLTCKRG